MTKNEWKRMVDDLFEAEHVRDVKWESTNSCHRRVSGKVTVPGAKEVTVSLIVSASPSDYRAIHRVRNNLRTAIRNARRINDGKVTA